MTARSIEEREMKDRVVIYRVSEEESFAGFWEVVSKLTHLNPSVHRLGGEVLVKVEAGLEAEARSYM